jgi:hypothetical protein
LIDFNKPIIGKRKANEQLKPKENINWKPVLGFIGVIVILDIILFSVWI